MYSLTHLPTNLITFLSEKQIILYIRAVIEMTCDPMDQHFYLYWRHVQKKNR